MELTYGNEENRLFKRIDWLLVLTIFSFTAIGMLNLYSTTHSHQDVSPVSSFFMKQAMFWGLAWLVFFAATLFNYRNIIQLAYLFYIFNLSLIVYVTFFGKTALGAQRWMHLGPFSLQPSETMKLALVMTLARYLSRMTLPENGLGLKELFIPLLLIALPTFFVLEQPDLGTALIFIFIGSSMLWFAKLKNWLIAMGLLAGLIGAPLTWNFMLRDYQKNRILNFLSPERDPRGTGYNSIQSKIAIGSGQILGKGFQKGTQSQLEFLPERHTDFVFSVLSEEYGFLGSVGVLILFSILLVNLFHIASTAQNKFAILFTFGVLMMLSTHIFINVGMVMGLLPVVGVPLPFLSYGGSSLLTIMLALGIVSNIASKRYLFN
jgi:rod shape determining protein RodA